MAYFLGIDIGTSSTKTALIDETGKTWAVHSAGYSVQQGAGGAATQDVALWWEAVCQTTRAVLAEADVSPKTVAAVGLSGQMHGLVALDSTGEVLAPARIWMDTTTTNYLHTLPQGDIAAITLNRPATGFLALSLGQMRRTHPALYAKVRQVLLPKDYIRYKLCGHYGTDYSDASGSMAFNPRSLSWDDGLLELLGVERALFPPCHGAHAVAGQLTKGAAQQTGLLAGTPVVYGGGDNAMQNMGNGLYRPGILTSNIGTAAQLATVAETPQCDPTHRVNTFCYVEQGLWSIVMPTEQPRNFPVGEKLSDNTEKFAASKKRRTESS